MKLVKTLVLTVASIGLSSSVYAANGDMNVKAKVLQPIAITEITDLDFGDHSQGDAADAIAPGSGRAASFKVLGTPTANFTVTYANGGTTTISTDGGGPLKDIAVTAFDDDVSQAGQLDPTGEKVVSVGATLAAIDANQVAGDYLGTMNITVEYAP
ncbi:DUF4402 domain-containing protein [bacterium]|nr:DUF4402 domain-containing protein [bacterium]